MTTEIRLRKQISKSIAKITSALTTRLPAHIRLLQEHKISNESDPSRIFNQNIYIKIFSKLSIYLSIYLSIIIKQGFLSPHAATSLSKDGQIVPRVASQFFYKLFPVKRIR
ncbi:hypothetical protein YC2023_093801 [Brassica napus]